MITIYGYISYHKAKGYHKLAVIEDDTGKKAVYLQQAKPDYDIVDSQKDFPEPIQFKEIRANGRRWI